MKIKTAGLLSRKGFAAILLCYLCLAITPVQAQTSTSTSNSSGSSNGFVQVINQVGQQGLALFRAILFVFLMIYAVLLGVAVAFGQAGSQEISSFVIGTMVAAGAQLIASIYLATLS